MIDGIIKGGPWLPDEVRRQQTLIPPPNSSPLPGDPRLSRKLFLVCAPGRPPGGQQLQHREHMLVTVVFSDDPYPHSTLGFAEHSTAGKITKTIMPLVS